MSRPRPAAARSAGWVRKSGLAAGAPLFGRLLFRLSVGRWPDKGEARPFLAGLVDQSVPLPPVLRAMLPMADAKTLISQFLLLDMVRTGRLQTHNAFDRHHAAERAVSIPPLCGNPVAFWRGPPVAFLHLEKTGGGAVAQLLTDACHPEQIDPDPWRTAAPHAVTPFAGRDAAAIRRRALVFGHYDLPSLRQLDPGRPVVTLLRDPARRIVSLYHYWRSVNRDVLDSTVGNDAVRLAHECDLLGFLQTRDVSVRNYIDNFYARRLTATYVQASGHDALADDPGACLDRALEALGGIAFVGLTEHMGASLERLGRRFDLETETSSERHNTSADNASIAPRVFRAIPRASLTTEHEQALASLTTLDAMLYAAACARFDAEGGTAG